MDVFEFKRLWVQSHIDRPIVEFAPVFYDVFPLIKETTQSNYVIRFLCARFEETFRISHMINGGPRIFVMKLLDVSHAYTLEVTLATLRPIMFD